MQSIGLMTILHTGTPMHCEPITELFALLAWRNCPLSTVYDCYVWQIHRRLACKGFVISVFFSQHQQQTGQLLRRCGDGAVHTWPVQNASSVCWPALFAVFIYINRTSRHDLLQVHLSLFVSAVSRNSYSSFCSVVRLFSTDALHSSTKGRSGQLAGWAKKPDCLQSYNSCIYKEIPSPVAV